MNRSLFTVAAAVMLFCGCATQPVVVDTGPLPMAQRQIRYQARPVPKPPTPQVAAQETFPSQTQPAMTASPPSSAPASAGYLVCESADWAARITGNGFNDIAGGKAGQSIQLPSGRYHLTDLKFFVPDRDGQRWEIRVSRSLRTKVEADAKTAIPYGPPFTLSLKCTRKPADIIFAPLVMGRGHEQYSRGNFLSPTNKPIDVKMHITDSAGKTLFEGDFPFG